MVVAGGGGGALDCEGGLLDLVLEVVVVNRPQQPLIIPAPPNPPLLLTDPLKTIQVLPRARR